MGTTMFISRLRGYRGAVRVPSAVLAALLLAFVTPLSAQQSPSTLGQYVPPDEERDDLDRGFKLGGVDVILTAGLSLGYDTNVTLADQDGIDSMFYEGAAAVRVELPTRRSLSHLTCDVESRQFTDSPIDDYTIHGCRLGYTYDPTHRTLLDLYASYTAGVDRRGRGRRQGDSGLIEEAPDESQIFGVGGSWRYGGEDARGQFVLSASAMDIEYQNNREYTDVLDRDLLQLGGSFQWRVTQKTSALVSYHEQYIDYDVATYDSDERWFMLGASWRMTQKTSGKVEFGWQEKDFKDPQHADYDGATWDAQVDWRHRPRSLFTLRSYRRTQESDGYGAYVVRHETMLTWDYQWKWGFRTRFNVGITNDDHEGVRRDNYTTWALARVWSLGYYTSLGASLNYERRDSNVQQFNYDQFIAMLTLQGRF